MAASLCMSSLCQMETDSQRVQAAHTSMHTLTSKENLSETQCLGLKSKLPVPFRKSVLWIAGCGSSVHYLAMGLQIRDPQS